MKNNHQGKTPQAHISANAHKDHVVSHQWYANKYYHRVGEGIRAQEGTHWTWRVKFPYETSRIRRKVADE